MPLSFSTALSGLRASQNALGVTGNNIANANTTAYKSSSITFADISKAKKLLGYDPKTKIEEGTPKFVEWFQSKNLHKSD